MDMLEKIKHAAAFIDGRTSGFRPEVGIILGTGLGGLVDHIAIRHSIEYADIPDFPVSTVEGHKGRLIFGELGGVSSPCRGVSTIMRDIRRSRWSSLSG